MDLFSKYFEKRDMFSKYFEKIPLAPPPSAPSGRGEHGEVGGIVCVSVVISHTIYKLESLFIFCLIAAQAPSRSSTNYT